MGWGRGGERKRERGWKGERGLTVKVVGGWSSCVFRGATSTLRFWRGSPAPAWAHPWAGRLLPMPPSWDPAYAFLLNDSSHRYLLTGYICWVPRILSSAFISSYLNTLFAPVLVPGWKGAIPPVPALGLAANEWLAAGISVRALACCRVEALC